MSKVTTTIDERWRRATDAKVVQSMLRINDWGPRTQQTIKEEFGRRGLSLDRSTPGDGKHTEGPTAKRVEARPSTDPSPQYTGKSPAEHPLLVSKPPKDSEEDLDTQARPGTERAKSSIVQKRKTLRLNVGNAMIGALGLGLLMYAKGAPPPAVVRFALFGALAGLFYPNGTVAFVVGWGIGVALCPLLFDGQVSWAVALIPGIASGAFATRKSPI